MKVHAYGQNLMALPCLNIWLRLIRFGVLLQSSVHFSIRLIVLIQCKFSNRSFLPLVKFYCFYFKIVVGGTKGKSTMETLQSNAS